MQAPTLSLIHILREIKRIEGIIAQQRQWNREKNIRTAESKEKMLGRMKAELEAPEAELESLRFAFLPRMVSGNDVILASGLQKKSFDEKKLFAGVELHIRRGDRAFLLGPNGCGKTTLLRVLLGLSLIHIYRMRRLPYRFLLPACSEQ